MLRRSGRIDIMQSYFKRIEYSKDDDLKDAVSTLLKSRKNSVQSSGENFTQNLSSSLDILLDQKGKQYAYKYVTKNNMSPLQSSEQIKYEIGKFISLELFESDRRISCGAGINVATKAWCLNNMSKSDHILLLISYQAKDIVCVPYATDGKFRVRKCKVEKGTG